MSLSNKEIAELVVSQVGGKENIKTNTTCMTRLHLTFYNPTKVDLERIKKIEEVLGIVEGETLQIVFGPGKVTKIGSEISKITGITLVVDDEIDLTELAKENKQNMKKKQVHPVQRFFKHFANIFLPLLPGIAGAGLINGVTKAINVYNGNAFVGEWWYTVITTIGWALFLYLPILVGMNAAKEFKGSAVLGAIGGALSVSHAAMPLLAKVGEQQILLPFTNAVFNPRAGGILAAVFTGIALAYIERFVRKYVPEVLDMFLTPLITLLVGAFLSVLVLQPLGAFVTTGIFTAANFIFNSMGFVGGFILATIQLPLVSVGLHRAFTPIHAMLNNPDGATSGVNYLLPILMVAGGGQVGASLALYFKTKNKKLKKAIMASVPAGVLGVGEPLMYGVTLPLVRPFITACIGSGFGGAVISLLHVGAISQGVSGILAPLIMNPGSQFTYLIGLLVAYICGFLITYLFGYQEDRVTDIFG